MATTDSEPSFENMACVLDSQGQHPYNVRTMPHPSPSPNEVTIQTHAVAFNPVDTAIQSLGLLIPHYPWIPGCDAAGTITALGSSVADSYPFKVGDRVLAVADGTVSKKTENNAFQSHFATSARLVAKIPDYVSFKDACVLPLAFATAAVALFQRDGLGLPLPSLTRSTGDEKKAVLVWGGASSVGSCGIQLAKAAGFAAVVVASGKNEEYCKNVGADLVFDYNSPSVVNDIIAGIQAKGWELAGSFSAIYSPETVVSCSKIAAALRGCMHVATVYPPGVALPDGLAEGVKASVTDATVDDGYVLPHVFSEWMPAALEKGLLRCLPQALVVGKGVGEIQRGTDRMREGVSATKLVVEL